MSAIEGISQLLWNQRGKTKRKKDYYEKKRGDDLPLGTGFISPLQWPSIPITTIVALHLYVDGKTEQCVFFTQHKSPSFQYGTALGRSCSCECVTINRSGGNEGILASSRHLNRL